MSQYPVELAPDFNGERWRLAGDEIISHVHLRRRCRGPVCPLHRPTDHHMRDWRLHYRHDREIFERICEHGVGHPDPDTKFKPTDDGTHGCDGCCWSVPAAEDAERREGER